MAEYVPKQESFLATTVDLKRLLSAVSKQQRAAIETLVDLLKSKDETIKLKAASKLLEIQVEVAKVISEDQMKRLIAELKVNTDSPKGLVANDEAGRPLVDFHTVRAVE